MRETGIREIQSVPWGTHFCHFYDNPRDLLDVLVPYFRSGLRNNEACVWITSDPVSAEEAKQALNTEVGDLSQRMKQEQIEILDYSQWYIEDGKFDRDKVLQAWMRKLDSAKTKGYSGLRVTGNTSWLNDDLWQPFEEYESRISDAIREHPVLVLCSYALGRCGASEALDVVNNHEFALTRGSERWRIIQSFEQRRYERALRKSQEYQRIISDTAAKLLISDDPQGIVNDLCRDIMERLDCHAFFNYLVDEKQERLHLNACAGISEETAKEIEWLDYGTAVCGCVAREGCRIVTEHIPTTDDPRTDLVKPFGIKAYACHPLLSSKSKVIGTLSFGTQSRETFSEEELSVMRTVADHVSVAMERKRNEEQLQRTAEDLKRSNTDLEQFAYVASHDLQEPLRTIRSYLQIIQRRYRGKLDSDADEFIDFASDGAARLQNLILDLLAFSRVETLGKPFAPTKSQGALSDALRALNKTIQDTAAVVTADPLPTVLADKGQLAQIFQNLVGNAVKFRREGVIPSVHIGATECNNGWIFSATDNGIGIDARYYEKIFTIFQRLHSSAQYKGSGIGLAICKRIVERHGGRIWVESQPGTGTTFFFTLPKA